MQCLHVPAMFCHTGEVYLLDLLDMPFKLREIEYNYIHLISLFCIWWCGLLVRVCSYDPGDRDPIPCSATGLSSDVKTSHSGLSFLICNIGTMNSRASKCFEIPECKVLNKHRVLFTLLHG